MSFGLKLFDILTANATAAKSYINRMLAKKQDKLTFDSAPTTRSSNPVTSDGIKNYIDTIDNTLTIAISKKADSSKIPSIPTNISTFENDAGYIQYFNLNGRTDLQIIKANKIVNYDEQIPAIPPTPGIVLKEDSSNITYGNVDIRALENCKISFSFYEGGGPRIYDYTLDMHGNFSGNAATATTATKATTALNIPTSDVGGNIWIA